MYDPRRTVAQVVTFLFFATTILVLSGCKTPEGNARRGQDWYAMNTCYSCHGKNGNDGDGPTIAGVDMSYRQFLKRLRKAQTQVMPAYPEEKISDQDAADILAYLQTLD